MNHNLSIQYEVRNEDKRRDSNLPTATGFSSHSLCFKMYLAEGKHDRDKTEFNISSLGYRLPDIAKSQNVNEQCHHKAFDTSLLFLMIPLSPCQFP